MKCPYCEKEMVEGTLSGDMRSILTFSPDDKPLRWYDRLAGTGRLTAAMKGSWYTYTYKVKAQFCNVCKKIIIDTDVSK